MALDMTFDIFCCKLNNIYPLVPGKGFTGSRPVKNVRLHDGIHFVQDYLYLLDEETYRREHENYKNCSVVLTDTDPEGTIPKGNVAAVRTEASVSDLFHQATVIFAEFYDWRERLHDFDDTTQSLASLLPRISDFMEMELIITNRYYRVDFSTRNGKTEDPMGVNAISEDEAHSLLNTQPEFAQSFNTHGVQPYPPNPYQGLLYYYNIFDEGEYLARLLAAFPDQIFLSGRVRLFDYLTAFAEKAYLHYRHNTSRHRKKTQFVKTLKNFVTGQVFDQLTAEKDLGSYGWHPEHTFQIIKLELEEYKGNLVSRDYFCAQFDQRFSSCCTLQLHNEIISIRNLSLETGEMDFYKEFPCFLRENLCRAGISNPVQSARNLPMLTMEAQDALTYGRQKNNTFWYWHFQDYILEYLRDHIVHQYPADQLEHRALAILRAYDAKNHSTLYDTLHMFTIQRFSASAAAASLYIHRSTFLHRLQRIEQLTKLDFSDEKVRMWLMISFFIRG